MNKPEGELIFTLTPRLKDELNTFITNLEKSKIKEKLPEYLENKTLEDFFDKFEEETSHTYPTYCLTFFLYLSGYSLKDIFEASHSIDRKHNYLSFCNCNGLTEITLPVVDDPTTDDWDLTDCQALTKITIPEGYKSIGKYFCSDCRKLKEIYLPNSMEHVNTSAFDYDYELETIHFNRDQDELDDSIKFQFNFCPRLKYIKCNDGTIMDKDE